MDGDSKNNTTLNQFKSSSSSTKRVAGGSPESADAPASKRPALPPAYNGGHLILNSAGAAPNVVNEKGAFAGHFPAESEGLDESLLKNNDDSHKGRGCRCGKTKCLKLYCQCFGHGALCAPECVCTECYNDGKHEDERMLAVKERRRNNPDHFKGTDLEARNMEVRSPGGTVHTVRGCRCRKSRCQKKYCECFSAGLSCAENCICLDCDNGNGEGAPNQEKNEVARVSAHVDPSSSTVPPPYMLQTLAGAFAAGHIVSSSSSQADSATGLHSVALDESRSKPMPAKPANGRKRHMTVDLPAKAFPSTAVIPLSGPNWPSESQKQDLHESGLHALATFAAQQTPSPSIDFGAKGLTFDNSNPLSAGSQPAGMQRFMSDTSLLGGLWTPGAPGSLGLPSPGPGSGAFSSLPGSAFQMFQPWSPHEVMRSAGRTGFSGPAPWAALAGGTGGAATDSTASASSAATAETGALSPSGGGAPRSVGLVPLCNSLQASHPPWGGAGDNMAPGADAEGIRAGSAANSARA